MSSAEGSYGRLERVLARLDFAWRASGTQLAYVDEHGIWSTRFRPGGPHGLWIAGHLAFYEGGALKLYGQFESNPVEEWKELFRNGSACRDDLSGYPDPAEVLARLRDGRSKAREAIASMTDADLDRALERNPRSERLAIRDIQSQIEFMIWHDSHHAAQLGAIANTHKASLAG